MHGRTVVKSAGMQLVEAREGQPIEALLRELYLDQRLTQEEIAARFGVSVDSVRRWMERFNIPTRWLGPRDQVNEVPVS